MHRETDREALEGDLAIAKIDGAVVANLAAVNLENDVVLFQLYRAVSERSCGCVGDGVRVTVVGWEGGVCVSVCLGPSSTAKWV